MSPKSIKIASCSIGRVELEYLAHCVEKNWITMGEYVQEFERSFAEYCNSKYAIASCNGTTALHLALIGIGVGIGDEVIVPSVTYIASCNAVKYCGATPVLCDILEDTWCIDPDAVRKCITPQTKAIIAVHLYGHPCNMNALRKIADEYGIALVEDAAEAHGAEVNGVRVGALGDVATFSFYGNKMITTGEGGMCTTNSEQIANKIRLYRGQGVDPSKRYWHAVVGYNYRITDLQAAVGCAQMGKLDDKIKHNRTLAEVYHACLANSGLVLPVEASWAKNVYWLYTVVIPDVTYDMRDKVIAKLSEMDIETRPIFYPIHQLPPYQDLGKDKDFPVACRVAKGGISLPTHSQINKEDAQFVSTSLISVINSL